MKEENFPKLMAFQRHSRTSGHFENGREKFISQRNEMSHTMTSDPSQMDKRR